MARLICELGSVEFKKLELLIEILGIVKFGLPKIALLVEPNHYWRWGGWG